MRSGARSAPHAPPACDPPRFHGDSAAPIDRGGPAADDIAGLNAKQIAQRLTISPADSFTVIKFPTPNSGLASPINRLEPGFVGGGRTAGGAREFVIPNGPIPPGATKEIVDP